MMNWLKELIVFRLVIVKIEKKKKYLTNDKYIVTQKSRKSATENLQNFNNFEIFKTRKFSKQK